MLVLSEAGGDPSFQGHPYHANSYMALDLQGPVGIGGPARASLKALAGLIQADFCRVFLYLPTTFGPADNSQPAVLLKAFVSSCAVNML